MQCSPANVLAALLLLTLANAVGPMPLCQRRGGMLPGALAAAAGPGRGSDVVASFGERLRGAAAAAQAATAAGTHPLEEEGGSFAFRGDASRNALSHGSDVDGTLRAAAPHGRPQQGGQQLRAVPQPQPREVDLPLATAALPSSPVNHPPLPQAQRQVQREAAVIAAAWEASVQPDVALRRGGGEGARRALHSEQAGRRVSVGLGPRHDDDCVRAGT